MFFLRFLAFGALLAGSTLFAAAAGRPNVLVLIADDQGWGDLSLHGNPDLATPHLDGLARGGAQFARFYVSPVCAPTRAEFLTGRYHPRGGVRGTGSGEERLDPGPPTVADAFRAAGYATGLFGKWHNGAYHPYHPNARGFDEFVGFCTGHWADYFSPPLEHNGRPVTGDGFLADDLATRTLRFIAAQAAAGRPFLATLAFPTPHSPMQVPDRWWDAARRRPLAVTPDDTHSRAALAMVENLDWNVGRLLAGLAELGLDRDTIVVFFSDNGPNGPRWNGGMRGIKGSTDEGGVRSPLFVRWPAQIPAGRVVAPPAAAIDLLPTLAALAGVTLPAGPPLDGQSLAPLLTGTDPATPPERILFTTWRGRVSAREGSLVLDDAGRLYDLATDPGQTRDLTTERPADAARLRTAVATWRREVATLPPDDRPIVVGHPGGLATELLADEAQTRGTLHRSNRFPNSSFITGWTAPTDSLAWDVAVPVAGEFAVELVGTCPEANVGVELVLEIREHRLPLRVTEPHDPPLRGAENDRHPRQESYTKDFRVLASGRLHLDPGRGPAVLRVTTRPGPGVIDFRLLRLTRLGD